MHSFHERIFLLAAVLLLSGILLTAGCQSTVSSSPSDSTVVDRIYNWPRLTLEQAIAKADHIVYGKVAEKKNQVTHTDAISGEDTLTNDVSIQVIQILKSSNTVSKNAATIQYFELPAPSEPAGSNTPPILQEGQEVVIFLSRYSGSLGPEFVIPIEEGMAKLMPHLKSELNQGSSASVSVEALCDKITG